MFKISYNSGQNWIRVSSSIFANTLQNTFGNHWQTVLKICDKSRVTIKTGDVWFKIEDGNEISKEQRERNVRLMRDMEKEID